MCLIIYKPNELSTFDEVSMKSSITRNDDGAGCMYVEDGRVVVEKIEGTYNRSNTVDTIYSWCMERLRSKSSIAIHHRMTTDGSNHLDNIHPYKVLSIDDGDPVDLYMMHNGIISNCRPSSRPGMGRIVYGDTDDEVLPAVCNPSDTQLFINRVLQPLLKHDHTLLNVPQFYTLIQEYIGTGSKLLFLDSNGKYTIINESAGKWLAQADGGCWISNTYSTTPPVTHTNHYYNYARPWDNTKDKVCDVNKELKEFVGGKYVAPPANKAVVPTKLTKTVYKDDDGDDDYEVTRFAHVKARKNHRDFWTGKSTDEIIEHLCMTNNMDDLGEFIHEDPFTAEEVMDTLLTYYWYHVNDTQSLNNDGTDDTGVYDDGEFFYRTATN